LLSAEERSKPDDEEEKEDVDDDEEMGVLDERTRTVLPMHPLMPLTLIGLGRVERK